MVTFNDFKTFFNKFPNKNNEFYYKQYPEGNKATIRSYKYRCKTTKETTATHVATHNNKRRKSLSIPPKNTAQEVLRFIDNPDELLLSTAIRELNKPNPDPRWATILINCKKEKITTKTEVIDQFKQLSIQARVNILKGLSQKTP